MISRHRIPTIFSIYMVDVLCCALGCVILLWLLNFREVRRNVAAAAETRKSLTQTKDSLTSTTQEVAGLRVSLQSSLDREKLLAQRIAEILKNKDMLLVQLDKTKQDHTDVTANLALHLALLEKTRLEVKDLQSLHAKIEAGLKDKTQAYADMVKKSQDLANQIALSEEKIRALEKELASSTTQSKLAARDIDNLLTKLKQADAKATSVEKDLARTIAESKTFQTQLAAALVRGRILEQDLTASKKDLFETTKILQDVLLDKDALTKRLLLSSRNMADAQSVIASLEKDRISLINKAQAIQFAAENRFAGITLTGQRVIFLIDMSGSMALRDQGTPAPEKWPQVCEIVGKIMRSLPTLKQYQIILFSDKVRYPLANEGRWLEYYPDLSHNTAVSALKAIEPKGETNISAGLDEAFRYRQLGLETIYFLSDGLPSAGDGLPANSGLLTEVQKTEYFTRYIRTKLKGDWNGPLPGRPRVHINAIGFFFESPELGAFLWSLARENEGSFVGMSHP